MKSSRNAIKWNLESSLSGSERGGRRAQSGQNLMAPRA